ncbi:hypothetical protein [Mycolicibacterium insubricum]|nr:hypothetical protein [Mycolicibacterium insubricum]
MDEAMDQLLGGTPAGSPTDPTSRYHDVGTSIFGDGLDAVTYYRRRLIPEPRAHTLLYQTRIADGDRRDNLAQRHLNSPYLWWILADANAIRDASELEGPAGQALRITTPATPEATDSDDEHA